MTDTRKYGNILAEVRCFKSCSVRRYYAMRSSVLVTCGQFWPCREGCRLLPTLSCCSEYHLASNGGHVLPSLCNYISLTNQSSKRWRHRKCVLIRRHHIPTGDLPSLHLRFKHLLRGQEVCISSLLSLSIFHGSCTHACLCRRSTCLCSRLSQLFVRVDHCW